MLSIERAFENQIVEAGNGQGDGTAPVVAADAVQGWVAVYPLRYSNSTEPGWRPASMMPATKYSTGLRSCEIFPHLTMGSTKQSRIRSPTYALSRENSSNGLPGKSREPDESPVGDAGQRARPNPQAGVNRSGSGAKPSASGAVQYSLYCGFHGIRLWFESDCGRPWVSVRPMTSPAFDPYGRP
jgi:hypothetical protein